MKKFIKGGGYYFPVESIIALELISGDDDMKIHIKALDGSAGSDSVLLDGGADNLNAKIAEALVEEINFGKQETIDLLKIHTSVTSATYSATV